MDKYKSYLEKMIYYSFFTLFLFYPFYFMITGNGLIVLVCSIIAALLWYLFYHLKLWNHIQIEEKYIVITVFVIAFILRVCWSLWSSKYITQVSDFKNAFEKAQTLNFTGQPTYYRIFTHWILYPVFMHGIFQIFGYSMLTASITNSVITSLVSVFIYKIVRLITNAKRTALFSSLLYVFWPSLIIYVNIFTPDHMASLLLILSVYLLLLIYQNFCRWKKWILVSILSLTGIILAFSDFFKSFSLVIIIAFIILLVVTTILSKDWKKSIISWFFIIPLIFPYSITKNLIFSYIDTQVGAPVGRNISMCYINVGLNSESKGFYSPKVYDMYTSSLLRNNYNFEETNSEISKSLMKDIRTHKDEFLPMLKDKAISGLHDDSDFIIWVSESMKASQPIDFITIQGPALIKISQYFYIMAIVGMFISLFRNTFKYRNISALFLFTIVIGTTFMLLLVETQGRYKYAILPLICVCAGCFVSKEKVEFHEELSEINESKALS